MSVSEWVTLIFAIAGGVLIVLAMLVAVANGVFSSSPRIWRTRKAGDTFVTFAWTEFGRALALGFVFALGFAPLTIFVFEDSEQFWSGFFWFSAVVWSNATIILFFMMILPGFVGYFGYNSARRGGPKSVTMFLELATVVGLMTPFLYVFFRFLLPTFSTVVGLLFETWQLYVRIYF